MKRKVPSSPPDEVDAVGQKDTDLPEDAPPFYGSQDYWEKRYGGAKQDDDASKPLPGHAWYFTYEELRPLILPLLLGRDLTQMKFLEESEDSDDSWQEVEEVAGEEGVKEDDEAEEDGSVIAHKNEGEGDNGADLLKKYLSSVDTQMPQPKSVLEIGCGDVALGLSLLMDLERVQRETGANASMVVNRIVCADYAKTVIDSLRDQQNSRWLASGITGEYTSIDGREGRTAQIVKVFPDASKISANKGGLVTSMLDVAFTQEDARDMPHKDGAFDLVIDKGTTDAMLSDKKHGVKFCVEIVAEMARVVAINGESPMKSFILCMGFVLNSAYIFMTANIPFGILHLMTHCHNLFSRPDFLEGHIMIVSHMNAHTEPGIEWCNEVLIGGLRASGAHSSWEIEVHGSDGCDECATDEDDDEDDDEEGDNEGRTNNYDEATDGTRSGDKRAEKASEKLISDADGPPSGSPGPAVYIVRKLPPRKNPSDETVPLKFFTY